ncbi:MAG: DUF4405 domain-containing protein [Verrucomicrobiota bacterium]
MTFRSRRYLGFSLVLLSAFVFWSINYALAIRLRSAAIVSGIILLTIVFALTFFNARKKLPFLPLLRASTWTQIHIYAGFVSVFLFGLHTGWRMPNGTLEIILAVLFLAVAGSGFVGLAISRLIPSRLTIHGENLIFERVPAMRAAVRNEAEELVVQSITANNSSTIADFYESNLKDYFAGPRFYLSHLMGNRRPLFKLISEVEAMDRYLNTQEREVMAQIAELIRKKDNLDFQLCGQAVLKGWLFVHIPLTYSLIVFAIIHGALAWSLS